MTNTNNPAAGWYPDPQNPMSQRYWDGTTWTDQTRPSMPSSPVPPPPPAAQVYGGAAPTITFGEAIKEGFSNFVTFDGRASRRAYWLFILFCFLVNLVASIFVPFVPFVLFLPQLAAAVRRMHDLNRSGWFAIIPFANLYYLCQPGDAGTNRYGPPTR